MKREGEIREAERYEGGRRANDKVFLVPPQYKLDLPNLRRVPTLLRPEQQRQHRISTNKSQINTRTCESGMRTKNGRGSTSSGSTHCDDGIDDEHDKVRDSCHDGVDDTADSGHDRALRLVSANCPLENSKNTHHYGRRLLDRRLKVGVG